MIVFKKKLRFDVSVNKLSWSIFLQNVELLISVTVGVPPLEDEATWI